MDLKDYGRAAEAFDRGANAPKAHPFLRVLAAQMAQHAGEIQTARMLWQATYASTQDDMIRQNAVEHLRALQVDENITELEKMVAQYRQQTGVAPSSFNALIYMLAFCAGCRWTQMGNPHELMADGREIPDAIVLSASDR